MTGPATPASPDWDSIARYLSGESNADEAAIVRAWLDANPADRELLERLNASTAADASAAPADVGVDIDVEAALARVHQRMQEPARPTLTVERGTNSARRTRRLAFATSLTAAAAAAAATFAILTVRSKP